MDAVATKETVRFFEKVEITEGEGDCWLWQGAVAGSGYGYFYFRGKSVCAHRVAWILANGEIPPGLCILHTCDNPLCVRPGHLFLGDRASNMADMVAKGRGANAAGENNNMNKLTEAQVIEIRRRYAAGDVSQRELGEEFGVTNSAISHITRRRRWKHVV